MAGTEDASGRYGAIEDWSAGSMTLATVMLLKSLSRGDAEALLAKGNLRTALA